MALSPFPGQPPLVRVGALALGLVLCGCDPTSGKDKRSDDGTVTDGTDSITQTAPTCGPCCHNGTQCDTGLYTTPTETGHTGDTGQSTR